MEDLAPCQGTSCSVCRKKARRDLLCKSEDSVKQNLYNYVGESTSTFASEKGPPLADVERLKGNMRRELRNEKYPFNCTDFASPNLRIYIHRPRVFRWEAYSSCQNKRRRSSKARTPVRLAATCCRRLLWQPCWSHW